MTLPGCTAEFAGLEVHFTVDGETLTVTDITRR